MALGLALVTCGSDQRYSCQSWSLVVVVGPKAKCLGKERAVTRTFILIAIATGVTAPLVSSLVKLCQTPTSQAQGQAQAKDMVTEHELTKSKSVKAVTVSLHSASGAS